MTEMTTKREIFSVAAQATAAVAACIGTVAVLMLPVIAAL
jgi:hypothetical protein